ncbi:MAG: ATP-binding protein [Candidatus Binataceae bacterium]
MPHQSQIGIALALVAGVAAGFVIGWLLRHRRAVRRDARIKALVERAADETSDAVERPKANSRPRGVGGQVARMLRRLTANFKARLAELDRERSKTNAIIESIEDGLVVLDRAKSIVHINEIACAILEVDAREVLSRRLAEVAGRSPHITRMLAARREPGTDQSAPAEFKLFVRGRDHTYLSRELPWHGAGGEHLGTILLLQDVTFVRDQERNRTNLIATLSHELKTPVTSLGIAADLLTETLPSSADRQQRELAATIRDDAGRLCTIADTLLDASRTTAARISVERAPIMLDRVVREACLTLARQAEEKAVRLDVTNDGGPVPVWGDPIKLPWVMTNLIGNALRYTPSGGRIGVEVRRDGRIARAVVSDTGPGIAPEVLPKIFEPYAQFAGEFAEMGSAGLGLYIAKEIVEAHNGRIYVESEMGRGAVFKVDLPLREDAGG